MPKTSKCEICNENLSKYTCPKCSKKTCSLACVKKHKTTTLCTGVRDKTEYVEMRGFTDRHLLNDYRFLEEVGRVSENNYRDPFQRKASNNGYANQVRKAAMKRNTRVKILPYPMRKRKINSTRLSQYLHGEILWHLELVFPQAEAMYTKRRVSENLSISDILTEYIHPTESDPVKRQKLKRYTHTGIESCRVFMKAEGQPANDTRYHEMDVTKSLKENLSGKEIIEYPILHVVLREKCQQYRLVEEDNQEDCDTSEKGDNCCIDSSSQNMVEAKTLVDIQAT